MIYSSHWDFKVPMNIPPPPKKKIFLIKLLKISGNLVRCSPFYKYQTPLHRTTGINIYMYYWISRNLFFKQIFENFRFINFTSKMFWEAMFHLSSIKIYGAYSHWIFLLEERQAEKSIHLFKRLEKKTIAILLYVLICHNVISPNRISWIIQHYINCI